MIHAAKEKGKPRRERISPEKWPEPKPVRETKPDKSPAKEPSRRRELTPA